MERDAGVSQRVDALEASRLRVLTAANQQRRSYERALHDGPQQHLVALAVSVRLARTLAKSDPDAVDGVLAQLGDDVQTSLEELRELAHRIYPPLLEDRGLAQALSSAGDRLAGHLEVGEIARLPADVEAAVYFCCVDALEHDGTRVKAGRDGEGLHLSFAGTDIDAVQVEDYVNALGGRVTAGASGVDALIPA